MIQRQRSHGICTFLLTPIALESFSQKSAAGLQKLRPFKANVVAGEIDYHLWMRYVQRRTKR